MKEPSAKTHQVTELLAAWSHGDKEALDKLMPLVYDELRRLARQHMRRERAGHTLQTAALVNEAYLRLVDQRRAQWDVVALVASMKAAIDCGICSSSDICCPFGLQVFDVRRSE